MTTDYLLNLLLAFFTSWQVKLIAGLILLDLGLGVAAAVRNKKFELAKVADFYRVAVLPYILGYAVLYVVINFVLPADQLGDAAWLNAGAVDLAGGILALNLLGSIKKSFVELYQRSPDV